MRRVKKTSVVSLVVLAMAVTSAAVQGCSLLGPPRPKPGQSLLVVVIDSLRADHVGAYGYPRATTPRIDELARDGVVFTHAYAQAPWTKPSVASLFTSTYASVHRVLYSKQIIDGEQRSDILNEKFLTLAETLKRGGYATGGFGKKIHLLPKFGFDQGFDDYDMHARGAERVNRRTLKFLRNEDPDRFFIYLHYNDAHYPYKPRIEYAKFGATESRVQIIGETKRAFRAGELQLTKDDARQFLDLYDGEILFTDHYIGELLEGLERLGYGNVLTIVTSDHGEEFLEHGDITHGQSLYQELVRIPFIVGGSGLPASARGLRVDPPVELIDIMPTFLELAGLPQPPGLQGRSFAQVLQGDAEAAASRAVFSERRERKENRFWGSVIEDRWKLIVDASNDRTLLFDIEADPQEMSSVESDNPDVVAALEEKMAAWSAINGTLYEQIRPEDTTPLDPETEEQLRSLGYIE
jgi:arylsulfatase A-like enzyme